MITMIHEEMGQTTNATIEVKVIYGGKFGLTTDLELKGRGVTKDGDGSNHKRGKKTYSVTQLAFNKIKTQHECCLKASL